MLGARRRKPDRSRNSPGWRSERKTVAILFAVAIVLYLPGIWWGLPYATAPDRVKAWGSDELAPLGPIAELYSVFVHPNPTFNPQYPLFHYIVQALAVGPYVLALWLTGQLSQPSVEYPYGLSDPVTALAVMTLLARSMSLLMAAGVVVIAYKTATILWDSRAGIIAAVLVLLMYPMFYYSRTSNVDMAALFWTSLGLAVFAACLRDSLTPRRAAWLGVFAALATATKDQSYATFLIIALVLLPWHLRQQHLQGHGWANIWPAPIVGFLTVLGVYAISSGFVLHLGRYLSHVSFIIHGSPYTWGGTSYGTAAGISDYLSLVSESTVHIVDSLSAPVAVCSAVGMVLCMVRNPQPLLFAVPILGTLLGVIFPARFVLFRFVMVMAYIFAFFAAYTLATALQARRPIIRRAAQMSLLIACGLPLLRGADLTYQMIYDARYDMAAWFQQHAKPGDDIGFYGAPDKLPPLDYGVVTTPMPEQPIPAHLRNKYPIPTNNPPAKPEFVVVIPQQTFEPVHEKALPDDVYASLLDGSFGYRLVFEQQTRPWFPKRLISFVNPHIKIFARDDNVDKSP